MGSIYEVLSATRIVSRLTVMLIFCFRPGEQGQRVRVVSVPAFAAQPMVVLVNLATLQCHPISFAVDTL
jgi:hypothetical protein